MGNTSGSFTCMCNDLAFSTCFSTFIPRGTITHIPCVFHVAVPAGFSVRI